MLRFDGYPRGPSFPSQREQRRLLLLVLVIGGVVLIPQWISFLGFFGPSVPTKAEHQVPIGSENGGRADTTNRQDGPAPSGRGQELIEQLAEIDFSSIEDNTPFRKEEKMAWFATLDILARFSPSDLRAAKPPWVTFSQLYRNAAQYRGNVVAIRGEFMGVVHYPAPPNDKGIKGYYQAWLRPDRENDPVVVYCLRLPPGFPKGMRIQEPVEVVGVFFKRWVYHAQDGLRAAPVVLTNEPYWMSPPQSSGSAPDSSPNLILATIVSLVLTGVFVLYILRRRKSHGPRSLNGH